ncbi:hypothetical protein DVH24_010236 [Malus domestica]|uniref:DOMON domain-containing protein n=1 Tax=Malus domestica TaxID=3750 RepID=A0A498JXI5_MALDO|nr:hypothetical protein DVH24_010236 [Malus domestica]
MMTELRGITMAVGLASLPFALCCLIMNKKHGTCSSPVVGDEYNYFLTTLNVYFKYNVTQILNEAGYVPSNTEKYPLGGIVSAIQNAFWATPRLVCKKGAVEELHLCFYKDFQPRDCLVGSGSLSDKLASSSSCPSFVSIPAYASLGLGGGEAEISTTVNSQTDSCSSTLNLQNVNLPFDAASLNCFAVWDAHNYILRYSQTLSNLWTFVLSAPAANSYIAIGFSSNGQMVGSSAIVGWMSPTGGEIKQYYLGGTSPNLVEPNKGSLQIGSNFSLFTSQSNRTYLGFQLETNQPLSRLIYAVGPDGLLPVAPNYRLTEHSDKVSTSINYITGVLCGFALNNKLNADVSTHKSLGIFVLVLGCLQVMALLVRPEKESKVRRYWNWYHQGVGRILIIFAVANVFYGIHLGEKGKGWSAGYGVVISILFVTAFILELRLWLRK